MSDIYTQHAAAFRNVAAYVIMRGSERVATIAFKFPADGASRLYAYVHWIGEPMVRGFAGGGGYDKRSAACADAARKMREIYSASSKIEDHVAYQTLRRALVKDDGAEWHNRLRDAGFEIFQAV
jgi:hypothetical protein